MKVQITKVSMSREPEDREKGLPERWVPDIEYRLLHEDGKATGASGNYPVTSTRANELLQDILEECRASVSEYLFGESRFEATQPGTLVPLRKDE